MKMLIMFLVVVVIKFSLNFHNFLRIKQLSNYHLEFLEGKRPNFTEYRQEVIELFRKAHVKNAYIPVSEPTGYGQIVNMNVDVFSMFPSEFSIISAPAIKMFSEAQGVFRKNMFDSINPIFWIEFLIFLPKNLLIYLGLNQKKALFKTFNLIFTFLWWFFCTLVTFFQAEIKQFIIEFFGNF